MLYEIKLLISVTRDVLKFSKLIDLNELQPENIFAIDLTNEVLKLDKSIDNNNSHLKNI